MSDGVHFEGDESKNSPVTVLSKHAESANTATKITKKAKRWCRNTPTVGAEIHQRVGAKVHQHNKNTKTTNFKTEYQSGDTPLSRLKKIEGQVVKRTKSAVEKKREQTRKGCSVPVLMKTWWLPAVREFWPEAVSRVWTLKEQGQLKRFIAGKKLADELGSRPIKWLS